MPFQTPDILSDVTVRIGSQDIPVTYFASSVGTFFDQVDSVKKAWEKWGGDISEEILLTPLGKAIFQEYGDQRFEMTFVHTYHPKSVGRKRPRNTRVLFVQAKRKSMGLDQCGKCFPFKTRKTSYAYKKGNYDYKTNERKVV